MEISKNIYISKNIKNKDEIISLLLKRIEVFSLYLICILKEDKNLFHIFKSKYLINSSKNWLIIGLANNKEDALELLKQVIQDNIDKDIYELKKFF